LTQAHIVEADTIADAFRKKVFRDPYTLHKSIWEIFGDKADRERVFLYRYDLIDGRPLMYSVFDRLPDRGIAAWDIETKMYNPQIKSGMALSFIKGKGKRQINISTLDFISLLTVIDPELFLGTLYNGIGPAKGFGCGMMMIKRI